MDFHTPLRYQFVQQFLINDTREANSFFCNHLYRVYCRQSCIAYSARCFPFLIFFFLRNAKPITSMIVVLHSPTASCLSPYSTITHNKQLFHARVVHIGFIFQRTMPQNLKTRGFLCTKTCLFAKHGPGAMSSLCKGMSIIFQLLFQSILPM